MKVGVCKETFPDEKRVALIPDSVPTCKKMGIEVVIQIGAGVAAGYPDEAYREKGAILVPERADVFGEADLVAQVRGYGANPEAGKEDLDLFREGQSVIAFFEPLTEHDQLKAIAEKKVTAFSMELMPRITRAQSMDALSSMATVAGYKAVLIAADAAPRMFPMFMTAAGTISPAKVFVIGAGVAGLQAIATAKRLGAIVHAYDVRPAVKEQIESLGGKFVHMDLESGDAEDKGGYAKAMDEEFYRKQRELMARVVAENHITITTAAIPGKKSPVLITGEMVKGMMSGSVIVDLAAERGGNCELTKAGETIVEHGVTIIGATNLPTTIPFHASQMYAKNVTNFLKELSKDGELALEPSDNEVHEGTLLCRDGKIVHARVRELMGLEPLKENEPAEEGDAEKKDS